MPRLLASARANLRGELVPSEYVEISLVATAGAQPKGTRGEVRAVVVAAHHADALGEDLAVVGDPHRVARQRRADGADLDQRRGCSP